MIKLGKGALNAIYPIGSIYMSMNGTNPSQLFGGTWEQIIGRFLWATNSTPGLTGGSKNHTLTVEEMPTHTHQYWTNIASTTTTGMAENLVGQAQQLNYILEIWRYNRPVVEKLIITCLRI